MKVEVYPQFGRFLCPASFSVTRAMSESGGDDWLVSDEEDQQVLQGSVNMEQRDRVKMESQFENVGRAY